MVTDIVERLRNGPDGSGWSCDFASECDLIDEAADEIERLRTERTETEADLNAARARAEMAEARIAAARIEVAEITTNHQPMWVSEQAKAAGKDPWVCHVCGTADGSWPCVARMAAEAALAALDGEDQA